MKNCFRFFFCAVVFLWCTALTYSSHTDPAKFRFPIANHAQTATNSLPRAETPPNLQTLLNSNGDLQSIGIDPAQFSAPVHATITKVEQSADGTYLVELLLQMWLVDAWINSYRYVYTYDTNGDRIQELRQTWQGSNWVNQMRIAFLYAAIGRVSGSLWEIWQVNQWVNYERSTYTYNGNLLLTAVLWEYWQVSLWVNYYQYLYAYDGSDREIDYTVQRWISNAWVNYYRYLYTYFTGNLLLEFLYQQWISDTWTNYQRQTSTYKGGVRTQVLDEDWNGSAWVNVYLYLYTYNVSNLLLTFLVQEWINDAWENYSDEWYYYDKYDDPIEIVRRLWIAGAWVFADRYLYTYTLKRLLSQIIWQRWEEVTIRGTSGAGTAVMESTWVDLQRQVGTYSSTTDIDDNTVAYSFRLYENYPNPFNPGTELRFEVASLGFVSLKIFDILGKEVATLVNESLPAGSYTRKWEASGLPSGVYYYRLTTGEFSDVKKMVLIK